MKLSTIHVALIFILGIILGMLSNKLFKANEGFTTATNDSGCPTVAAPPAKPQCGVCNQQLTTCSCSKPQPVCPPCRQPDMSKYVLKATIPPCPVCPDLSDYIKKSEIPPVPDLSKYVLRSSIPKQQPVILDCSKCQKPSGECPPCPRPRCPEVKCPEPTKCPACAPCPRQTCPSTVVKCKAEDAAVDTVRPYLAPLNWNSFGSA